MFRTRKLAIGLVLLLMLGCTETALEVEKGKGHTDGASVSESAQPRDDIATTAEPTTANESGEDAEPKRKSVVNSLLRAVAHGAAEALGEESPREASPPSSPGSD